MKEPNEQGFKCFVCGESYSCCLCNIPKNVTLIIEGEERKGKSILAFNITKYLEVKMKKQDIKRARSTAKKKAKEKSSKQEKKKTKQKKL